MPSLKRKSKDIRSQSNKVRRQDSEYSEKESLQNKERMAVKRTDPEFRLVENERNKESKSEKRNDVEYRQAENVRNKESKSEKRNDVEYRQAENVRNKESKSEKRNDVKYRQVEKNQDKLRKKNQRALLSWDDCREQFILKKKCGPTVVCCCCSGLWFIDSVVFITREKFAKNCCIGYEDLYLPAGYGEVQPFCNYCWKCITKGKVPTLSVKNGFKYPTVPIELQGLTQLEERLCALRLPFMQIRTLGVGRQYGLKGNVINIVNTIDSTASVLPRRFDNTSTIQLQLKRKMQYKHYYMFETIRPAKVFIACQYLCNTDVYKEENVLLMEDWKDRLVEDTLPFVVDESDKHILDDTKSVVEEEESDDLDVNPGGNETLIYNIDSLEDNQAVVYAPGENKKPISLISDVYAEELAFPTIYCGQKRLFPNRVSYMDIAKSEARRYDRRACLPSKLLYSFKVLQTHQISDLLSICLRKKKLGSVTAKELLNTESINKLVQHNDGFRLLKSIRGSPPYWEDKQKNVLAMVRQLGIPTFFITLSAAETHWPELIVILKKILDNEVITEDQAMELPYESKADLIRRDPITCARYFDWRVRLWKKYILLADCGAFQGYKVVDFFYRIEFQHRGSPHLHGLFWLENAPKFNEDCETSNQVCANFIDQFISCTANIEGIIHQHHKHTTTCERILKNGQKSCRFNMPYPPMSRTRILTPLPEGIDSLYRRSLLSKFNLMKLKLDDLNKTGVKDISFPEFMTLIEMDEETYIACIRSSLNRPTVFLKRNVLSVYENAYNDKMAMLWRSNMDIQFIVDAYACVKYCVSYIAKSCRGMSKLLKAAVEDAQFGNLSIKEKLRKVAYVFLNSTEISAQEAAYAILGLNLSMSSRTCVFISTGLPEDRIFMTKSNNDLEKLSPDSNDVVLVGLLDHYANRPDVLSDVCLADFAACYAFSTTNRKSNQKEVEEFEDDDLQDQEGLKVYPLKNNSGFIRERTKPKVIRYRRYNKDLDENNYYREQIMLYMPWRNEEVDILNHNKKQLFANNVAIIVSNSKKYEIQNDIHDIDVDLISASEEEAEIEIDSEYVIFDTENISVGMVDLFGLPKDKLKVFNLPNMIPSKEYQSLMRLLNAGQRKYMYHILHNIKSRKKQWFNIVCGGAGTGKSFLITAIVQSVIRYLNSLPGSNPSAVKILICAPTGKAAYNIGGTTLHEAFCLPLNQFQGGMPKLSNDFCNTIASKLCDLQFIIIDEVSMMSVAMLMQVNERMQHIFQSKEPFGGKSVLLVGDFHQLKPVCGSLVFSQPKCIASLVGNFLWEKFSFYELTEIMRQKDDLLFANALNRLAIGQMTSSDIELFSSREISKAGFPPKQAVRLFYDNLSVHVYNQKYLDSLEFEGFIAKARDKCQGKGKNKEAILEAARELNVREAQGLPYEITFKEGVKYMMTANIDVGDGLVNGATGVLKKIVYGTINTDRVAALVFILFDTAKSGAAKRNELRGFDLEKQLNWTPIAPITKLVKNWEGKDLSVTRCQFPLVVAEAMTIHKSQGGTFESVVIQSSKRMQRAALYVACSRATKLSGLYIDGTFNAPLPVSEYDVIEMELSRLRAIAIQWSYRSFNKLGTSSMNIVFHNVEDLETHFEDVFCDQQYQNCDLLLFCETWSLTGESYKIPNFNTLQRLDCENKKEKQSKGLSAFANVNSVKNIQPVDVMRYNLKDGVIELGTIIVDAVYVIYGYKSPNVKYDDLSHILSNWIQKYSGAEICVVGDFNLDIGNNNGGKLISLLKQSNFELKSPLMQSSTNLGTQIDLCFSNFEKCESWYGESYWSYHKPVFIELNKDIMDCMVVEKMDTENDNEKIDFEMLESEISVLSLEQKDKVADVNMIPVVNHIEIFNEMKLSVNGYQIYSRDIGSLYRSMWLTDSILNAYASQLYNACLDSRIFILNTYFCWRDEEGIYRNMSGFFPSGTQQSVFYVPSLHINHWFLIKVDAMHGVITVMDSYPGLIDANGHVDYLINVLGNISQMKNTSWKTEIIKNINFQKNGFDCGCYLLWFLESCLKGVPLHDNPNGMQHYRTSIAKSLLNVNPNTADFLKSFSSVEKMLESLNH